MTHRSSRRTFLKSTAVAPLAAACLTPALAANAAAAAAANATAPETGAAAAPAARAAGGSPQKSVLFSMLPKELPVADRFKIAVDAGFVGVEMHTEPDKALAEQARDAAAKTGLKIHSVMN